MPAERAFKVKVGGSAIPQSVTVNGKTVNYVYDGNSLSLLIDIPIADAKCEKQVLITYPEQTADLLLMDIQRYIIHRMNGLTPHLKYLRHISDTNDVFRLGHSSPLKGFPYPFNRILM